MSNADGYETNDSPHSLKTDMNYPVLTQRCFCHRSVVGSFVMSVLIGSMVTGCAASPSASEEILLRERATLCLNRALHYPENPAVRAQAIEAAVEVLGTQGKMSVREKLEDEHAGVRFAACVALGQLQDRSAWAVIQKLTRDPDPSVRVAAYFAAEQMGESRYRRAWVELLRRHEDPVVRRNAVMLLGQLGEQRVIPLLQSAGFEDKDEGVQLQVVEALALLGDADAVNRLMRDAYGGLGFRQPFALLAIGKVENNRVVSVLRSRLDSAPYPEARLAAARSLAMHGDPSGYDCAVRLLDWSDADEQLPDDLPANQIMRVQTMAAMALGDIGDRRALRWLRQRMESSDDPRIQLAAARSILVILNGTLVEDRIEETLPEPEP